MPTVSAERPDTPPTVIVLPAGRTLGVDRLLVVAVWSSAAMLCGASWFGIYEALHALLR